MKIIIHYSYYSLAYLKNIKTEKKYVNFTSTPILPSTSLWNNLFLALVKALFSSSPFTTFRFTGVLCKIRILLPADCVSLSVSVSSSVHESLPNEAIWSSHNFKLFSNASRFFKRLKQLLQIYLKSVRFRKRLLTLSGKLLHNFVAIDKFPIIL